MIPMKDINGVIHNIEYVTPKEPKDIWRHHIKGEKGISGRSDGLFFGINGTNDCFLCEGLSTGLTIHYATGATVICAFNAGNLPKVAAEFKAAHPTYNYKVCADNDLWRDDGKNPGADGGKEAARILGCECVFPKFKDTATKPTDFNDLGVLEGVGPLREQVHSPGENFSAKSPSQTSFKNNCRKRPPDREYLLTYKGAGFLPKGIVGLLAATGGTGKTFFLLTLANTLACGGKLGPIEAVQLFKVLIVCGEDDQDELYRRMWDICHGVFPDNLYGVSTVGEVGPLMKMDGKNPVRADGFRWLENTIQLHEDIDILFLDPKSRFYGLEENNNDHGTQWVQCLEYLSKKYGITILFTSHTSEQNAGKISQVMNRGASAIVDGCRWAAGMCQMSKEIADKYSIENPKEYVVLDLPKSNYTALLRTPLYFKREANGVLKYSDLGRERFEEMGGFLLELIRNDANQYTKNELVRMPVGNGIAQDMKENFPSFVRSKDMVCVIDLLVKVKSLQAILINPGRNSKEVLVPGEVK
jgi:replicative DNA helicase